MISNILQAMKCILLLVLITLSCFTIAYPGGESHRIDNPLHEKCIAILRNSITDTNPSVKLIAVFLTGETGLSFASKELETVLLTDTAPEIRARAAEAIGKSKDSTSIKALQKALKKDKDAFSRACAAEAIGKLGDQSSLKHLKAALGDKDELVRVAATEAMIRLGDKGNFGNLLAALKSDNPQVRRWACDAFVNLNNKSALEDLRVIAQNDNDPLVKIWAARAVLLLSTDDPKGVREKYSIIIADFTQNDSPGVRSRVACALGDVNTGSSLKILKSMLGNNNENTTVKLWAAEAMGKLGSRSLGPLRSAARNDSNPGVRIWSAEAMGRLGRINPALSMITPLLQDEDAITRLHAAKAILNLMKDEREPHS